jgi:hypothetical protein
MSILKKLFGGGNKNPITPLTKQLDTLGGKQFIMPIEIFSLANAFVEFPDKNSVIETLTQEKYAAHTSPHVRRVVVITLRRMQIFDLPNVVELMYQKLDDSNPWVAYDAAWYFKESKLKVDKITKKLKEIAGDKADMSEEELKNLSSEHLSDAEIRLQIEAAEALKA